MDLRPVDYTSGLGRLPDPLRDMQEQLAASIGLQRGQLANEGQQIENQTHQGELDQRQAFQRDMEQALVNPTPQNFSNVIANHPEYAQQVKQAWEIRDRSERQSELTQIGEVYSAARNGQWKLAAATLKRRIDADRAAGHEDPQDAAMLAALESSNPVEQRAALGMIGTHLAILTGPEHMGTVLTEMNRDRGFTLGQGQQRFDENGKVVASVAPETRYLVVPEGGKAIPIGPEGPGQDIAGGASSGGSAPGATSPHAAAVSSALASAGLPAQVVAGFMGNFHVEGGYDGAQGDGGSASGIAQWHNDRAANFARVIGKPVTEATPAEQAQFVAWEMQHPEAAGMTVAQRDKILAAKTPAEAAALIDRYYERSSGRDRSTRMAAADAFARGTAPQASAPRTALGGDPPGTIRGNPRPQARTLTPAEATARGLDPKKIYELKPDGSIQAVGDAATGNDPLGNPNLTGEAYLASLPTATRNQVRAIAEGRMQPPASFALAKPYWQKVMSSVLQYDPSFDASRAPERRAAILAFTGNGKAAQTIGSVNRAANHLNTLYQASEKLTGPDTGFGPLNSVLAYGGQRFQPQALKSFNTALSLVAGEMEKIARNSPGTLHGVEQVMSNLSPNESLSTRREAIRTAVELIHGAIEPLQNQYNSAFLGSTARPDIPWVDRRSMDIYRKIGGIDFSLNGESGSARGAGSAPVRVRSLQEARRLAPGTVFVTPDGRQKVRP